MRFRNLDIYRTQETIEPLYERALVRKLYFCKIELGEYIIISYMPISLYVYFITYNGESCSQIAGKSHKHKKLV